MNLRLRWALALLFHNSILDYSGKPLCPLGPVSSSLRFSLWIEEPKQYPNDHLHSQPPLDSASSIKCFILGFLKIWLSPLIPLTFLFPSTTISAQRNVQRNPPTPYRHWLRLSGFTTVIGDGAFQVVHGISVLLVASSWRSFRGALRSPAFFIPVLWLLTGLFLKLLYLDGLDHLSTAASWLWAPLLCLTFAALNSEQLSTYLQAVAVGLGLSSGFGIILWLLNPPLETPILNLLPFISSLHQAQIPGSHDAWAASGFFFHRLKFAHLGLILLPTLLFIPKGLIRTLVASVVIAAITLSHAAWALIVGGALFVLYAFFVSFGRSHGANCSPLPHSYVRSLSISHS